MDVSRQAQSLRIALDRWLQTDCGLEDVAFDTGIGASGRNDSLFAFLTDAAVEGPSDSLLSLALLSLSGTLDRIETAYFSGDSLLLSEVDRALIREFSRESYLEEKVVAWAVAYRGRALVALGRLRYERGRELCAAVLADPALIALHGAARQAMEMLE